MKKYFEKSIERFLFTSFQKLKIKKNDIIYLGLDLTQFFLPFIEFFPDYKKKEINIYFCKLLFRLLKKYFSNEGTFIFPAFTWSCLKNKKFKKYQTKPEIGAFEKYLFNKRGVVRSAHPINSVLSWGTKSKEITKDHGAYSFGYNTPFQKFKEFGVKFVNIGIPFYDTCTYIHHLEHLNGCNHRYYKSIQEQNYIKNKFVKKNYFFLVKYKSFDSKIKRNEKKLYKVLIREKKIKTFTKKRVIFSSTNSEDVFYEGLKLLNKDSCAFMSKKIIVFMKENNKKINIRKREKKIIVNYNLVLN
jgi:aminoglycoside N3'-acetyltransferase